jgi:hypothetical protein
MSSEHLKPECGSYVGNMFGESHTFMHTKDLSVDFEKKE